MKVLHVACLPFPTFQGTQAAIGSMLTASAGADIETHLLVYGHGAEMRRWPFTVHRIRNAVPVRSMRSGPSVGKVVLDLQMSQRAHALVAKIKPDRIVAHHVEAAAAMQAARVRCTDYVSHTCLHDELPTYAPTHLHRPLALGGRLIDALSVRTGERSFAVSPALAERLACATRAPVAYLPVPWRVPVPARITAQEARYALGIAESATCLYAGNLDDYQGWENVLHATKVLVGQRIDARCLVATESDASPVHELAAQIGMTNRLSVRRLNGEMQRRLVHAASDVVVVPRRTPGGLPIKLLDALARGVPVVTTQRATSGLDVGRACDVVTNDSGSALATAIDKNLHNGEVRVKRALDGPAYVQEHHSADGFVRALYQAPSETTSRAAATNWAGAPSASKSSTVHH